MSACATGRAARALRAVLAAVGLGLLSACASLGPNPPAATLPAVSGGLSDGAEAWCSVPAGALKPDADLWHRVRRQLQWHAIEHERIARERTHFLSQQNYLEIVGERGQWYLHHIVEQVEQRGLPLELALLPLVESAMNPLAESPSRAAGLWQIMPATADHLGLRRTWWYDERLDLRASTATALDYLQSLYHEFDEDWLLALAAYNAGKGRVARARERNLAMGLPSDYWSLSLPRETRRYVPRLLALAAIVHDAPELAVALPPIPNRSPFVSIDTGGQIELQRAAQLAGIELQVLRNLNAAHRRWATAPGHDELLLPVASRVRFERELAALSPQQRVSWAHYRIRNGDSLSGIARRFNTEVRLLAEVNRISGHLIRAGDTLLIPRGGAWNESLALAAADIHTPRKRAYRVRPGDSLHRIATRFKVTVDELISWNSLDRSQYLQPGQQLTLYTRGG